MYVILPIQILSVKLRSRGEGGGFYGIESRADIRKLDIYEGTEEGFTGVSEVLWAVWLLPLQWIAQASTFNRPALSPR